MLDAAVAGQLRQIVGEKYFRDDRESLIAHSYDGIPMLQHIPGGVVYPESTK